MYYNISLISIMGAALSYTNFLSGKILGNGTSRSIATMAQPLKVVKKPIYMNEILLRLEANDQKISVIRSIHDGHFNIHDPRTSKILTRLQESEVIILSQWNKNGVYYNFERRLFPNVETIIMHNSHPCDYDVPYRFRNQLWYINGFNRYFDGLAFANLNHEEEKKLSGLIQSGKGYSIHGTIGENFKEINLVADSNEDEKDEKEKNADGSINNLSIISSNINMTI